MGRMCVRKGRRSVSVRKVVIHRIMEGFCINEMHKLKGYLAAFFTSRQPRGFAGLRIHLVSFGPQLIEGASNDFPLGYNPRVKQNCGEMQKLGRVSERVSTHLNCARVSSRLHRVRCALACAQPALNVISPYFRLFVAIHMIFFF